MHVLTAHEHRTAQQLSNAAALDNAAPNTFIYVTCLVVVGCGCGFGLKPVPAAAKNAETEYFLVFLLSSKIGFFRDAAAFFFCKAF